VGKKADPTEPKWRRFERLVAALHHSLAPGGAQIEWSESIDGREFDITIRFNNLGYDYLTLVECKDYRAPVKEVEAFVTKSRRAKANKAVMVSSEGFQQGAIKVAREENIELYVLRETDRWPEGVRVVAEQPAIIVHALEILNRTGRVAHRFLDNPSALFYFAHHVRISENDATSTLDEVINRSAATWQKDIGETPRRRRVKLHQPAVVEVPHVDPMPASAIRFTARRGALLTIDAGGADPNVVPPLFSFRNELTTDEKLIDSGDIWLGFDTVIRPDTF